jgi:hypothetical protein
MELKIGPADLELTNYRINSALWSLESTTTLTIAKDLLKLSTLNRMTSFQYFIHIQHKHIYTINIPFKPGRLLVEI